MSKKGFTLIEIVVSIIILATLAGLAATSYTIQKRRSEYNGMRAIILSLTSAAKNLYYATWNNVATDLSSFDTMDTNDKYQLAIRDGNFFNYCIGPPAVVGQEFSVTVDYGPRGTLGDFSTTATYTYDSNGNQVNCVGDDCMTP